MDTAPIDPTTLHSRLGAAAREAGRRGADTHRLDGGNERHDWVPAPTGASQ